MKVFVVMGNDFPDAVFLTEEGANKYIEKKKKDSKEYRIYWRFYAFEAKP